jgi:hypothetical protein
MTPRADRSVWIEAALKLGVPSVLAGFLVWWVTTVVAASLSTIQADLSDHVTATNIYLRAICLHTAGHDQASRDECPAVPPRKGDR